MKASDRAAVSETNPLSSSSGGRNLLRQVGGIAASDSLNITDNNNVISI